MQFSERRNTTRWVIIFASFLIISLILWNTYTFFQIFKNEERLKMNLWAKAQKTLNNAGENTDVELPLQIFSNNTSIPIIVTENDSIINTVNIDDAIVKNKSKAQDFLSKLKSENEPIVIEYVPGKFQNLYYGNSALLNKLKYYPVALVLIIVLFGALVYNFYRSTKMATQNKLWAGMAKETAHQIGTPLSSLIGWVELLKSENVDESTTFEIEKDIERLQTITDRFSKIGSEPKLENKDIVAETFQSYDYLQSRFSKQIEFSFKAPKSPIIVSLNPTLHSWTIENLVKNAIDAMKGKGKLALEIEQEGDSVKINVTDTGSGIQKNQFKSIFEPGFTTKKRGWGLGLSLTKRIVEEYHKGTIKVLNSEIGKGTTMQVSFKKSNLV
ncbi:MAG: HAMP domain-containing sensor histidine kinase [Flavobacterium sp.]|jgi:two-component system, sporulation sensor kinase D|uniref:histidine kinase n=1 Tax=Flavobacterium algoritolerans TaxID=3041254 RepID=A0ABT6V6C2_9FLAO|nr:MULTISPECIES: HAMP domain-containing sensor histidine kinase [Flavobacterium]MDI5886767.1 HAMP domain-containing sensor histidine kinase [Flavobacterium yafengii]MDI5893781.1 HAMP domain-containing sensor histidine kinase [Flavobacterium algoritolerans]MDI6049785.1 HAMP domain-containing sensor histidine kinase [Flavobacterium sp. XS2P24]MDP3680915.1 HAMP domain-containing sensor histidine kinase [Flavobacterium sp.]RKS15412.1 histidine kinase/DNA gyrase B/HSP90-like ATPase [Flavobacterium 